MERRKKKLGIIGGMGSRAGANFLQRVIDLSPAANDQEFVEIFLHSNSNIPDRTRAIVYGEACPLDEIIRSIGIMNDNEVDLIVLTCNTSYYYYDAFFQYTNARIINPVNLLGAYVTEHKFKKVGLLATTGTIQSGIFCQELKKRGCEVLKLEREEQEQIFMASVYMENGLKSSVISATAIDMMYMAADILIEKGADLLVGGCSEVSIALQQNGMKAPYIDTMDLLAKEVVRECYVTHNYGIDARVATKEIL